MGKNKAVTIDRDIVMPPLTDKDLAALKICNEKRISHVALSFANRSRDVDFIRSQMSCSVFLISKIESLKGVENLEAIASKSEAILLDRGDMSRQVSIEQIPALQKDIIKRVKVVGSKMYVATNLLESMVKSSVPTRAEVNDIFNTLNDGADGLVLAAETAIGSYPINCASMVLKVIKEFRSFKSDLTNNLGKSSSLIAPHGGVLIDRVATSFDIDEIKKYKKISVGETVIMDAEQIALGTFSPIEGFLNKEEVESVLGKYKLLNGVIWPLPIILQVPKKVCDDLKVGEKVSLILEGTEDIYAVLTVGDIYSYDLDDMSIKMFGTNDVDHPGVEVLKSKGGCFLGGKIELLKRLSSSNKHFEITPKQSRMIFEQKGWDRIVSFHTRNVVHRAHESIQMMAFEKYHCDGLFVHPVVGPKKKGDYRAEIILKSYQLMMDNHYPKGRALLGAFQSYSRYCGPREAVFTAICQKNFGCSHFIIGRDHTGVGNFYSPTASQDIFLELGDIGIKPVFFNEMYYCNQCKEYTDKCSHDKSNFMSISGTQSRNMLKDLQVPPEWFMREDISSLIIEVMNKGGEVFV